MLPALIGSLGIIVTAAAAAFAAYGLYKTRSPYYRVVGIFFWSYFLLAFVAPPPPILALIEGNPYNGPQGLRNLLLGLLVASIAASLIKAIKSSRAPRASRRES